jgi:hypothetical protein
MNENLNNMNIYKDLGLAMPITSIPEIPPEEPQEPPEEPNEPPEEPPTPPSTSLVKIALRCPHCKEVIFETEADVEPV